MCDRTTFPFAGTVVFALRRWVKTFHIDVDEGLAVNRCASWRWMLLGFHQGC